MDKIIFALFILCACANAGAAQKPNILWIITDDQRADSIEIFNKILTGKSDSALGPVASPNVDKLAAEGTTFINAYCQSAACAPSRAAMHSGRYPHHSGIYGFEKHHTNNPEITKPTIPVVLADAGYQTSAAGKIGERTIGWDGKRWDWNKIQYQQYLAPFKVMARAGFADWRSEEVFAKHKETGRAESFIFEDGERFDIFTPRKGERDAANQAKRNTVEKRLDLLYHYLPDGSVKSQIVGGVSSRKAGHTRDGYYLKAVADFLSHPDASYTSPWGNQYRGPDTKRPQFINLGFDFPHTPVLPPASYREQFAQFTYKVPEFTEAEREAFPPQLMKLFKDKQTSHFTPDEMQQMIRDYYAFCAYGDSLVGEAVEIFKAYCTAQKQPWMILYVCGDHGMRLNEHGTWEKFGPWKLDTHDPIIVVSSDKTAFPAGKVVDDFVEFVDMAPTFYAAAGLDLAAPKFTHLDGADLAKVASGKHPARDYVLSEGWWVTGPRATIRTKEFMFSMKIKNSMRPGKDMEWPLSADLKDVEPLLYNLSSDPGETNNLALNPEFQQVVAAMREKLQNIVLGDGRIEVDWGKGLKGESYSTNFAPGSDDKKLALPGVTIPNK